MRDEAGRHGMERDEPGWAGTGQRWAAWGGEREWDGTRWGGGVGVMGHGRMGRDGAGWGGMGRGGAGRVRVGRDGWDEGEMGRRGGGHTVHWELPSCAAPITPCCATSVLAGAVGMGWDGMVRDMARWGAVAGEGHGGSEGEGWGRDGWEEGEGMGEGVAMRHTCNRGVEDAEEIGPPRGGPPGWRGVGPLSPAPWTRARLSAVFESTWNRSKQGDSGG